jgi:hypothetical protein
VAKISKAVYESEHSIESDLDPDLGRNSVMKKRMGAGLICVVGLSAVSLAYFAGRARAAGIPATTPMTYSGVLTDMAGTPLTGSKNIQIQFWDAATAGNSTCMVGPASQMLNAGAFQVALPDTCTAAVHGSPDQWVEVFVDGASLGRTKLGAVPYAVEADKAKSAATAAQATSAATATDATGDIHPTSITASGAITANGMVSLKSGVDLGSRVSKTAATTGTAFAAATLAGTNLCSAGSHPCTSWEAMVIDELSTTSPFDEQGWIIGSFPNLDFHLRSLANGQDSLICPTNSYLTKYASKFQQGAITTTGSLHCAAAATSFPVWCCKDKS